MLRLYYSNRLEDLIPPLAESVREQQARDPLEPVTIVVPGRVMEQYLKLELAERLGVAANLRCYFLQEFLSKVLGSVESSLKPLEKQQMELLLFHRLGEEDLLAVEEMKPVRSYLDLSSSRIDRDLRRLHLARETARLFMEYAFSRREMLAAWIRGPRMEDTAFRETERWQRCLWLSVLDAQGFLRAGARRATEPRRVLLPYAFDGLEIGDLEWRDPAHFFGLFYLAPAFSSIFARLASRIDLHLYTLSPCPEFREDAEGLPRIDGTGWISRKHVSAAGISGEADPFDLDREGESRALRLWGRPGREHIRLLNEATCPEVAARFGVPGRGAQGTLLERIQHDLLSRRSEGAADGLTPAASDDGSIRFLECPGIRREVEIVASEIWSLVQSNDREAGGQSGRLRFHELAIAMSEPAAEAYLPHIETVFLQLHRIPLNLLQNPRGSESRVTEAIELLLALPSGRFGRSEMVGLLTHPCIAGAASGGNTDRLRSWCDQVNVLFGADRDEFRNTYVHPKDLYNWDQALRRMALGTFMTEPRGGAPGIWGEGATACLPLEISPGQVPAAASMVSLARRLLSEAQFCRGASLPLETWAEYFAALVRTFVVPSNPVDEGILDRTADAIRETAKADLEGRPIPFGVAREIIKGTLADQESHRGRLDRSGVAVGTFMALRAIPFRVIFAMGLGEGKFPATERNDRIDLRAEKRQAGDATLTERDRYLFLEMLLSARERLVLSFVSRDAQTGEDLEPSTVIRELQFLLREHARPEILASLSVRHPVSRYDGHYFSDPGTAGGSRNLSSADPAARRGALLYAFRKNLLDYLKDTPLPSAKEVLLESLSIPTRERLAPHLRLETLPERDLAAPMERVSLSLTALRKFIECPLQGAAQYALGLFEDELETSEEREEPLAESILDRTRIAREAFVQGGGDPARALEAYEERFSRRELAGSGPTGPFGRSEREGVRRTLETWHENAETLNLRDLSRWKVFRFGNADALKNADEFLPSIPLTVQLPAPGGGTREVHVSLQGRTELVSPGLEAVLRCVLKDRGKLGESDYLPLFMSVIALAAADRPVSENFRAAILPGDVFKRARSERIIEPLSGTDARDYLARLVEALLSSRHDYFLPYAAVISVREKFKDPTVDLLPEIERFRRDPQSRCESDYGPVPNARRFPSPSRHDIRPIIEMRYGPLLRWGPLPRQGRKS